MLMRKRINATEGPILSQMLVYSVPLLLSTLVQQMFNSLNSVICVFGLRIVWMAFIYPHFQTYQSLVLCFLCSWIALFFLNLVMVTVVLRRYRMGLYKRF